MCGICGTLSFDQRLETSPEVWSRCVTPSPIADRTTRAPGPRPTGGWRSATAGCRSSTCPPPATSRCRNEDGDRLDHLQRRGLQPRGAARRARGPRAHVYRSRTDTETIVHLYEEEGPEVRRRASTACSRSRSGTRAAGELLLARDRLGVKPLLLRAAHPDGSGVRLGGQSDPPTPSGARRNSTRTRSTTTSRSPSPRRRARCSTASTSWPRPSGMIVRATTASQARALLDAVVRRRPRRRVRAMGETRWSSEHARVAAQTRSRSG